MSDEFSEAEFAAAFRVYDERKAALDEAEHQLHLIAAARLYQRSVARQAPPADDGMHWSTV